MLSNGQLKCWGDNSYGELGDGNAILASQRGGPSTSHSSIPVTVAGINTAVAVTSSDGYHSCAVLQNGSVQCWGDNVSGQLGDGTRATAVTPVADPFTPLNPLPVIEKEIAAALSRAQAE